jgi:hypothetical protein
MAPIANSSTYASISHAIDEIHSLGMKVLLKPMLDVNDGTPTTDPTWRAFIDPTDKDQWFANYTNYLNQFADLAQQKGVELFSIGCEMNTLEQSPNNTRWTNLISNMRSRYSGKLTYAANWAPLTGNIGGYQSLPWWNQLDYIGIDAYLPIAGSGNFNPTPAQLQTAWQADANSIESWRAGRGLTTKQVLFTEVGYQSADGTAQSPAGVPTNPPPAVDLQEQSDCYNALLSVMTAKPWWDGAFWWSWDTNPYAGGPTNANFTPQFKPASNVLASYYGGIAPTNRGHQTQTVFSWESGLEGWSVPSFQNLPASIAQSPLHATAGSHSLAVTQTGSGFSWDAGLQLSGDALAALTGALLDGASKYRLEFDITYDTNLIPPSANWIAQSIAINCNTGWSQVDLPSDSGQMNHTVHFAKLLSSWTSLSVNSPWFYLYLGLNGSWGSGPVTVFVDSFRLVNILVPLPGDFNGDGAVNAADYTVWRDTLGSTTDLRADANLNGVVDSGDYQLWRANYGSTGTSGSSSAAAVPEPASAMLAWLAAGFALCVLRPRQKEPPCAFSRFFNILLA